MAAVVAGAVMLLLGLVLFARARHLAHARAAAAALEVARLERALGDSQASFQRFVSALRDQAMYTLDTRGRVSSWNAAAEQINGVLAGYSVISRDLPERRRAEAQLLEKEDQLRQAQKMEAVGQLARGVAHDFNNILTAIGGFTKLLSLELPPDAPARRYVAEIENAKSRAAALTAQLLAFSRMPDSPPQPCDVNNRVRSVETILCRLLPSEIQLITDLEPGLPAVLIDPIQLEQVIMNLVLNARDALPCGGRITVRTRGINAQLPESDGMEGIIALSVEGIVARAGGRVQVRSRPGQGSCFTVVIPHAAEWTADAALAHQNVATPPAAPARGTVLVADDDDAVRLLTRIVLERAGYHVLAAADGAQALELFHEHRGDIVIVVSDAIMPGMNGRELAERLHEAAPAMPILFISGYAEHVLATRGVLDPDVRIVNKPFMPDDLLQAISLTLSDRAALHEARG